MSNDGEASDAAGGILYVVATPIGNLRDLSPRAVEVLSSVELVLAEDTRHSARLLDHYGIDTPRRALHEHNESALVPSLVARIVGGARVALICDAGTPLINDPGYLLVAELRTRGQRVIPVPGPNAALCALSVAGLPTDRFCFEGFLPARSAARRKRLAALAAETRTLVFYEAPHRVLETVTEIAAVFGASREAVIARELTKLHETVRKDALGALGKWLADHDEQRRGEFVIVVAGAPPSEPDPAALLDDLLRALLEALPLSQAVAVATKATGIRRNQVYRRAMTLADDNDEKGVGDE